MGALLWEKVWEQFVRIHDYENLGLGGPRNKNQDFV